MSIGLIETALSHSKYPVVAFSGGKDSTATLHLVRSVDPSVKAVFCNTGVEAPDTIRYCRSIPNLVELKPRKSFNQCVKEYGWPEVKAKAKTHGNQCCQWLKERPAMEYYKAEGVDLVFTGLTADESRNRALLFIRLGPYYHAKTQGLDKCHPIHDWSEDKVWDFIRSNNLKYNPIYDKGSVRCGCMPCTAYLSWPERLAKENPKLLRSILRRRYGQTQCGDYV